MSPALAGPFRQHFQNNREATLQAFPEQDFGKMTLLNMRTIGPNN